MLYFEKKQVTLRLTNVSLAKLINYIHQNSVVKDIYKDNGKFIIITEVGQYDFDEQNQMMKNTQNRNVKLYILDSSFNPIRTILYDFISSPNVVVHSNFLYFITLMDSDDQIFTLNRLSLLEK